jgi:hypothetical protein
MLSFGFGGVPSTFVTNASNTEIKLLKNIVGFSRATDAQKNGTDLDLITLVIDLKATGSLYAQNPPQAMTNGSTTMLGLTYTASASSSAPESLARRAFGNTLDEQW